MLVLSRQCKPRLLTWRGYSHRASPCDSHFPFSDFRVATKHIALFGLEGSLNSAIASCSLRTEVDTEAPAYFSLRARFQLRPNGRWNRPTDRVPSLVSRYSLTFSPLPRLPPFR